MVGLLAAHAVKGLNAGRVGATSTTWCEHMHTTLCLKRTRCTAERGVYGADEECYPILRPYIAVSHGPETQLLVQLGNL